MDAPADNMTVRPNAGHADVRFDALLAEAQASLGAAANSLRDVRGRFRASYIDALERWERLRDELDSIDRDEREPVGVGDPGVRARELRRQVSVEGGQVGRERVELGRIDLALKSLENAWLFLERGDANLLDEATLPTGPAELQMRIVEAQEAERSRLAQEVHDGPAQALSNAIFQVEYIERVMTDDPRLARTELRFLRELLRRELGDVRAFISQLRPPLLVELGLEGAVREATERMSDLMGIPVAVDMAAPADHLPDAAQTVVLRIVQEALQNVRKHAEATRVTVRSSREADGWLLEIRDDGRGFDGAAVALRGRRNFGLQFMRERAELIGARFEVRSRPDGGTVVRLAIPEGKEDR